MEIYLENSNKTIIFAEKFPAMTQLTINIEDLSILPHLKKILNALEGVSIAKPSRKKRSGIDEAYDDIRAGRIHHAESVDDLFAQVFKD